MQRASRWILKVTHMKFLIPLLAACALAGCACFKSADAPAPDTGTLAESGYRRVSVEGEKATAAERAACEVAGGEISRQGMLGWEHCVQTYPDAGKVCSSGSDCIGSCRADINGPVAGTPAQGTCQTVDVPFGCYSVIENGVAQPALCVD